jgi:hypothetical protein
VDAADERGIDRLDRRLGASVDLSVLRTIDRRLERPFEVRLVPQLDRRDRERIAVGVRAPERASAPIAWRPRRRTNRSPGASRAHRTSRRGGAGRGAHCPGRAREDVRQRPDALPCEALDHGIHGAPVTPCTGPCCRDGAPGNCYAHGSQLRGA